MTDKKLAEGIKAHLAAHPDATVDELAEALEAPSEDVARVLDQWDAVKMKRVGEGGGGGWISE